jgi:hypothetical protein
MSPSSRLYIDLMSGSGFALANIALHRHADHVIVRKSSSFHSNNEISMEDEMEIFEAIATLPNLTWLDVVEVDDGGSLPVLGLAAALRLAKNLRILRLDSVLVSGRDEDFAHLVQALKNHPSISEVHLIGCLPARETETIQDLADALAGLKSLRVIEIVETRFSPCGAWTGRSLATLCESPFLKALRVRGVRFLRDPHVILLAQKLEKNSALEELSLLCDIGKPALTAICRMLCVNTTLQELCLNRIIHGEQAYELAQALEINSTLRGLHLYFRHCVVKDIRSCFHRLMERNYTLEKVAGGWACSNIEFFLKLNRAGRGSLLGESNKASPAEWVNVLATQQDCVSSLFYLLSQNPTLCAAN